MLGVAAFDAVLDRGAIVAVCEFGGEPLNDGIDVVTSRVLPAFVTAAAVG